MVRSILLQVYEAVMFWVRFDPTRRQEQLGELMQFVRLPLLPQEYLVSRVENDLKACQNCKDYLIEAMKYHLLKDEEKQVFEDATPRAKPRQPRGKPKVSLAFLRLQCTESLPSRPIQRNQCRVMLV